MPKSRKRIPAADLSGECVLNGHTRIPLLTLDLAKSGERERRITRRTPVNSSRPSIVYSDNDFDRRLFVLLELPWDVLVSLGQSDERILHSVD